MINENFADRNKLQDIGRWYVNEYVKYVASVLPAGSSILDAGAGECVYKKFFSHCDYKSIDLAVGESAWNYKNLDYVGFLHKMPLDDEKFEAVLCTQVLEHLEWPRESVKEMFRVLKPNGKLYMTVPMSQSEHQAPYDFFRYTSYGLESICRHAGFRDIKVAPLGGMWVRWAYELPRGLSVFPSSGLHTGKLNLSGLVILPFKVVAFCLVRFLQLMFLLLDKFDKKRNDPFGWSCEAKK